MNQKKIPYGESLFFIFSQIHLMSSSWLLVRLGNSGLKVSRIILGTMQYGNKGWQEWLLGEDEAFEHIKAA